MFMEYAANTWRFRRGAGGSARELRGWDRAALVG